MDGKIGKKNDWGTNNQAEGPRSRTECNDFKKVETCPNLFYTICQQNKVIINDKVRYLFFILLL